MVITSNHVVSWRGVPHVDEALKISIASAYKPECALNGDLVYLPRMRPQNPSLVKDLGEAGCVFLK